jgi:hypothetical protein
LPPSLTLEGVAAGGAVMSNVANVITTTTNTVVESANSAVSIGRWSNLAIIAFSFLSIFGKADHTAPPPWLVGLLISSGAIPYSSFFPFPAFGTILRAVGGGLDLVAVESEFSGWLPLV